LPARTVAIPRRSKIPATRRAIEHARGSRRLVKWRNGSEGRISYLKHRYGWDRTRLDGREEASIWCGHGVFAHNVGKISQPQLAAATRLGLSPPTFSGRSNLIGGSARGYQPGLRVVDLLAAAVTGHRTSRPQTAYVRIGAFGANARICRADRDIPGCGGAGVLVRRARRTGPVTLDGEAGRGSRRRAAREPRPGCLDTTEARGTISGMAGAWRPRAAPGPWDGRQPGSSGGP
jgi:transposase, IS5 family